MTSTGTQIAALSFFVAACLISSGSYLLGGFPGLLVGVGTSWLLLPITFYCNEMIK